LLLLPLLTQHTTSTKELQYAPCGELGPVCHRNQMPGLERLSPFFHPGFWPPKIGSSSKFAHPWATPSVLEAPLEKKHPSLQQHQQDKAIHFRALSSNWLARKLDNGSFLVGIFCLHLHGE
jgi:hypothetical protein